MILKFTVGTGFRKLDEYLTQDRSGKPREGATLIASNMGGRTPRERAREISGFRSARPGLSKGVGHLMISAPPGTALTREQWLEAIEIAKGEHGLGNAPFGAVLHTEKEHVHAHIFFLRIRPDGSVVSDSHSYRRNEAAARKIEEAFGLQPPKPVAADRKVGARERLGNAERRARRRSRSNGETMMDTTTLRQAVNDAIAASKTPEEFDDKLSSLGVSAAWTANRAGVSFVPHGATTAIKGSTLSRDLSARRLLEAIERNAMVPMQVTPVSGARPSAPLAAPAPLPAPPATSHPNASGADSALAAAVEAPTSAVDVAEEELASELRKLSIPELYRLRSARTETYDAVLALARIEKLVLLMLRLITLGRVKPRPQLADRISARLALGERAEVELLRRRRTPGGVAERRKLLDEQMLAARGEQARFSARAQAEQLVGLRSPLDIARARVMPAMEARFDSDQARKGEPGLVDARRAARAADADYVGLAALRVPRGFLAKRQTEDHQRQLQAAERRRQQARDRLELFVDSLVRAAAERIRAEAAAGVAERKHDEALRQQLEVELRTEIPAALHQLLMVDDQERIAAVAHELSAQDAAEPDRVAAGIATYLTRAVETGGDAPAGPG